MQIKIQFKTRTTPITKALIFGHEEYHCNHMQEQIVQLMLTMTNAPPHDYWLHYCKLSTSEYIK